MNEAALPRRTGVPLVLMMGVCSMLAACGERGALPAQDTAAAEGRGGAAASPAEARAAVLVHTADSLERAAAYAAASDRWREAAAQAPRLRHWLLLRAAAAQPARAERERLLDAVVLPGPADTAAWRRRREGAHLRALLRTGDTSAAVARYLALGNVRDSVVGLSLRLRRGEALTARERVALARGARRIGDAPLARAQYRALRDANVAELTAADRYDYGVLLFAAGELRQAMTVLGEVREPYAGRAAYQRARALLRQGQGAAASAALQRITREHADDSTAAGLAWYLLGDLAADAGRDGDAALAWRTLATRYPAHEWAARATFRAAMVQVAAGQWRRARALLAPLTQRENAEQWAAVYWSARALEAEGAREQAAAAWRTIIARAPDSYYALRAAQRLDTVPWTPRRERGDGTDGGRLDERTVADAFGRIAMLARWGLHDEARDERADLVLAASQHPADARRVATRLLEEELASPAMALAARVPELAQSARREDQQLRFALPYRTAIAEHAAANGLELALVAALIRQESRFTPTARSGAGALGVMQIMPAVGRSLADAAGVRPWHDSLLFVPAINIRLGTRHLASALRRDGDAHRAYALAAYNAGRSRVVRWRRTHGATRDWELFIERIPFEETRDYVRIVLRNEAWYRALYDE